MPWQYCVCVDIAVQGLELLLPGSSSSVESLETGAEGHVLSPMADELAPPQVGWCIARRDVEMQGLEALLPGFSSCVKSLVESLPSFSSSV